MIIDLSDKETLAFQVPQRLEKNGYIQAIHIYASTAP